MAKGKNAKAKTVEVKGKASSRKAAAVEDDDVVVADDGGDDAGEGKASGKAKGKSGGPSRKTKAVAAPGKSARRASAGPAEGNVGVTCRECGYEFLLDAARGREQETLTCSVCEHRAQSPSNDILHQIALYKGIENRNLMLTLVFLVVGLAAMVFWSVLTASEVRAEDSVVFFGPIGVAAVAWLATLVFGAKYERSRWETYF